MLRIARAMFVGLISTAAFSQTVLIENVRIFNGVDHKLKPGHVLVVDDKADLLLINGEPLEDISVLRNPETGLALITKQGEIVKPAL